MAAHYELRCAGIESLESLHLSWLSRYPSIERVEAVYLLAQSQGADEVTPQDPVLRLP